MTFPQSHKSQPIRSASVYKSARSLFNLVNTVPATEAAEEVLRSEFHGLTQETALGQRSLPDL